jgi:hypothetical protein
MGTVPSKYQYTASLTDLRLQLTGISGDLDSMLSDDRDPLTTFASDCLGPDPGVLCSCCETSCNVSSVWWTCDEVCVNATTNQQPWVTRSSAAWPNRFSDADCAVAIGVVVSAKGERGGHIPLSPTETEAPTTSPTIIATFDSINLFQRLISKVRRPRHHRPKISFHPVFLYFDRFMPLANNAAVSFGVETAMERGNHGSTENAYKTCVRAGGGWSYLWIQCWIPTLDLHWPLANQSTRIVSS